MPVAARLTSASPPRAALSLTPPRTPHAQRRIVDSADLAGTWGLPCPVPHPALLPGVTLLLLVVAGVVGWVYTGPGLAVLVFRGLDARRLLLPRCARTHTGSHQ